MSAQLQQGETYYDPGGLILAAEEEEARCLKQMLEEARAATEPGGNVSGVFKAVTHYQNACRALKKIRAALEPK